MRTKTIAGSAQCGWLILVKTLAALRPDEVEQVEPENEQDPTPSIVVYDLPPGAGPVGAPCHQQRRDTGPHA